MHEKNGKARFGGRGILLAGGLAALLLVLAGAQPAAAQGTITSISPGSIPAGNADFTLTVMATGFGTNPTIGWNGVTLPTTVNGNVLTATVPAADVALPGPVSIAVYSIIFNQVHTPPVAFTIAGPVITSLSPAGVVAGGNGLTLTINGSGFVQVFGENPSVYFDGNLIYPNFISSTQLQATIISAWVATARVVNVSVTDLDPLNSASPNFPFTIGQPLQLVSQSMTGGQQGTPYDFTFQTANGFPPLNFYASGLPGSLSINGATGEVTGTPSVVGVYHVSLVVTDSGGGTVTGQFTFNVVPPYVAPLAFIGPPLPQGQVGVSYTGGVSATGGVQPYTFSLAPVTANSAAGTLPPGLTIYPSGAIGGTPTTVGSYKFILQVADSAGTTATQGYTLNVVPPLLTIATGALSSAPAGTPLTIVFTAMGGYPGYAFSSDSGIPLGMTFSSSGTLTGTPTTPGTYTFAVTVKDNGGATASKSFSITITPPAFVILTTALPNGQVGVAYSVQFYAANGKPPYTWAATGLPAGVTMSSGGLLGGVPTADGPFTVAVTATDSTATFLNQAKQTYALTIAPAPLVITSTSLPAGVAGKAYAASLTASGGDVPYTWAVLGLPSTITASPGGALSGTPTSASSSTVSATVTDAKGATASGRFSLTVAPAPISITTALLPNGTVQTAYSVTVTATGGAGSNKWVATGLPAGLTMSTNGTIAGTPTGPGLSVVAITVTDAAGTVAVQTYNLTILPTALTITTQGLPAGATGTPYSAVMTAAGGAGSNQWTATGLPAGLSMSPAGTISGTPTAAGTFTVAVTVADAAGTQAKQTYNLTIAVQRLAIALLPMPLGVAGVPFSFTFVATGGTGSYQWSATGVPSGFTFSTGGTIAGTLAAPGSINITVTVTDSAGAMATQAFTLAFAPGPLTISTQALPAGVVGAAYTATLAATGGAGSNKWSATGLPGGLTLSAGGTISGMPTAPGTSVVVVTVTDSAGTLAVQTYAMTVLLPATPAVNLGSLPPTANPGTQAAVQVGMASAYPLPVTATLTLVFTPDSGADDPAVQFSTGGRTAVIEIPAGVTTPVGGVALQTGTVAGTITISVRLSAAGQDITPTPVPQQITRIPAAAPTISSVTAIRNASGFTVTVIGFATPRQVTQANFQFAAASGTTLQTASLAVPVTSLFSAWYGSAAAAAFGSQFSFVQPFTVTGNVQGVASVTVTLTNAQGTSAAVTANLQ